MNLNLMKLKKLFILFLSLVLLIIPGCENNTGNSGASSLKSGKSRLKGDFVFYTKNDGTYFTNCDDIEETMLSPGTVDYMYLDEKRNNIIYHSEGLYVRSIKPNSESIKIDEPGNIMPIIENKYIVYIGNGGRLFYYDLDTNNKYHISDKVVEKYIKYNSTITYIEKDSDNKQYNLCTFDLKSKKKTTSIIPEYNGKSVLMSNGVMYYIVSKDINDEMKESFLYKLESGKSLEMIDKMISNVEHYIKKNNIMKNGKEYTRYLSYKLVDSFNNGEMYYGKATSFADMDTDKGVYDYYFYDGKTSTLLNIEKDEGLGSFYGARYGWHPIKEYIGYNTYWENDIASWFNNKKNVSIVGGGSGKDSYFFIRDKKFDGWVIGVSDDCNSIVYNKKIGDSRYGYDYESFKYNIKNNSTENIKRISDVLYFDNSNILGIDDYNFDIVLNDTVIDYNYNPYYNGTHVDLIYEYNENLSVIKYMTNSGLCIYKDNQARVVSSNTRGGHITNNGNIYYLSGNDVYLDVNGETRHVASDVSFLGCYRDYDKPSYYITGYAIIR